MPWICIVCGKETNKIWYSMAIVFGAPDDIDVGPWCDNCAPSKRTLESKIRYLLRKMTLARITPIFPRYMSVPFHE